MQHHTDHGQFRVAGTGNAAGRHAKRVQVQRGPVDSRLSGRVRGKGGAVHAGRAERHPGRGQFRTVDDPVGRRRPVDHQERRVGAQHAADDGQVAAHVPEDPVQRKRAGPER